MNLMKLKLLDLRDNIINGTFAYRFPKKFFGKTVILLSNNKNKIKSWKFLNSESVHKFSDRYNPLVIVNPTKE